MIGGVIVRLAVNLWTIYGWMPGVPLSEGVLNELQKLGADGIELIMDEHHFAVDR